MMNQQQKQSSDFFPKNKKLSVVLIGDSCIDEYQYGVVDRISPEAPIPIFCPKNVEYKKGMAANVENNLSALGVAVKTYFSDQSIKIRMIDSRTKQHILRVDYDKQCSPVDVKEIDLHDADAIVISDYNKGTVTYELIDQLRRSCDLPIFIDTKKVDLAQFAGCIVKINEVEYKNRISDAENMIVTHGGSHVVHGQDSYQVPTVPVFDVCGAGDTFFAALVYQYLTTRCMKQAIEFAIKAAAVTVQHLGVYAPKLKEIE